MADLTITATNIVAADGYNPIDLIAGEAITRGQPFYTKAADGKAWLASCESTSAIATATGIALNDAAAGQPIRGINGGTLAFGAILTAGTFYVLSASGKISPSADLTASDFVTLLGVATSTGNLRILLYASGVEL
jgi:hypothetical protein